MQQVQDAKYSVDLVPYMGMYRADCECSWCMDRKNKKSTRFDFRNDPESRKKHKSSQSGAQSSGSMTSTRLEHETEDEMMDKVAGKGVSVVQLPGHQRPWKTQTYAVRFGVLKEVVDKLNGGTPTVDAFANCENARFSRYLG